MDSQWTLNLKQHPAIDVVKALSEAIEIVSRGEHDPHQAHGRVRGMYDWAQVAERTEHVYNGVMASEPIDLFTRMKRCVDIIFPHFVD